MIEQHNNSGIYRDVFEDQVEDFTFLGTRNLNSYTIEVKQDFHGLVIGDAVYYDIRTRTYKAALAKNSIMSEVIGLVSKLIDARTFEITTKGFLKTDRYDYMTNNSILYLSPVISGRLVDTEPGKISKIIGIKVKDGIEVDIQRGYDLHPENKEYEKPRFYTEQEIDNIIQTILKDIY